MVIIYGIQNKINKKIYVGSTRQKNNQRWKTHIKSLSKGEHYNDYLQSAWNKYGEDNFEFLILEMFDDIEEQFIKEQYWIDFYKSYQYDNGYNLTRTAGIVEMTEEVKKKISKTMKGRPLSQEHIIAFSQAKKGEKRSAETKKLLSEIAKGRKMSEETKKKISKSEKGKKLSEETKRKIAEARRGKKFPRKK